MIKGCLGESFYLGKVDWQVAGESPTGMLGKFKKTPLLCQCGLATFSGWKQIIIWPEWLGGYPFLGVYILYTQSGFERDNQPHSLSEGRSFLAHSLGCFQIPVSKPLNQTDSLCGYR